MRKAGAENLVGRKVAIQPLEGEFVEGAVLPDATIERLFRKKGNILAFAKFDVPIIARDPHSGNEAEVDRAVLEPYRSDLYRVFRQAGPSGMPVVALIRCLPKGAPNDSRGLLLGKAALWRAPDSVDPSPVDIPSHVDLQFRGIDEEAESLVDLLYRKYGMKLSYDEDSLLRLDDIIDSAVKPPVGKDSLGKVVVPWDSFLTKAVAVVFSGEFVKDPANGVKVRISTPKGVVETSPSTQMWLRLEQGRTEHTSITRYIEELRRRVGGD